MKRIHFALFSILLLLVGGMGLAGEAKFTNLNGAKVALSGYDPVSYHLGAPTKGAEQISLVHKEIVYYFHSEENKKRFKSEPIRYIPAYGGWCAWAMLDGKMVEINPMRYKIFEGRTFLFYKTFFTDTLKKWDDLAMKETEAALVLRADNHWRDILSGE